MLKDNECGIVIEPFRGTGTIAAVAEQMGWSCCGLDLDPQFAEKAKEQVEANQQDESEV